ncbi:MAG: ImmA/IrrE family metallo-endopeptidase [Campylobacter sp.]|uniref:ImmA/IrrE family metallo-endopeptidase n=1 Tax=Campylobacter sp. TaxID=205 RepID=UPI002AA71B70|nr:ImmA/IrrE family metallo-endopeptidase [Campylobacter sp.]MCI6695051.1 ImmA/IrrE family metallo-endopeptidase [Campylobacter sp.]
MAFISNKKEIKETKIITWEEMLLDAEKKNITLMPFDIYAYVNTFDNIEIIDDDLGLEISGMIEYASGGFVITINKYHSYERRRFTLAHEFGHYCMHREYLINNKSIKDVALFRSENTKDKKEFEANEFAAKLLMPKDDFLDVIKSGKTKLGDIAEHFGVSATAAKYRAYKLGLIKEY